MLRGHPWVFSGAILQYTGTFNEGDVVEVFTSNGDYLATGHYQDSSIAVKIFTFKRQEINRDFWLQQVTQACRLREQLGLINNPTTNVYRLVNAEGDSLPGLIADFYAGTLVIQCHSMGMYRIREELADVFREVMGKSLKAVFDKSAETLEQGSPKNGYLMGTPGSQEVMENGLRFLVDWEHGQKTGFYTDQRENRRLACTLAQGRNVLNLFCYSGGFSVYALAAGARLVHSVDASKPAIRLTEKNVALNEPYPGSHEAFMAEVKDFLARIEPGKYDMIILDPPAFAKTYRRSNNALIGYEYLNAMAMRSIAPEGILVTFSCSQAVERDPFESMVYSSLMEAGRSGQVLYRLSQGADHPVALSHPEGNYLKGLIVRIN